MERGLAMTSKPDRDEPLGIVMHSSAYVCLSESTPLDQLTSTDYQANLLVTCRDLAMSSVTKHLMAWCTPPFHLCAAPGALAPPSRRCGTLFLEGVSALSLAQQMDVDDWVIQAAGSVQVVSITRVPLWPLVEAGLFLQALFYRLNVVSLDAKPVKKVVRRSRERLMSVVRPPSVMLQKEWP